LAIVVLLSFARLCRILPHPGDISSNILENAIRPASSHALSLELALRAVYHHFPDQEALDGLHEQLRRQREHFAWLESEDHSLSQAASGLRKKIGQLEEQIERPRATGRFP
jgi:hypothetical protein